MSFGNSKNGKGPSVPGQGTLSRESTALIEAQQGVWRDADSGTAAMLKNRTDLSLRQKKAIKEQLTGATPTTAVHKGNAPKVAVPKFGAGSSRKPMPMPLGRFSGIRTKSDMEYQDPNLYKRDQFHGVSLYVDREAEKDKLAKTMEFNGRTEEERKATAAKYKQRLQAQEEAARPPVSDKDAMVDEILDGIAERQKFLDEMDRVGQGDQYRNQIHGEISSKLQLLKKMGVDVSAGRRR